MKILKQNRKNMFRICTMVLLAMLCQYMFCFNANAAGRAAKAKQAYRKYLANIYSKKDFKSYKRLGTNSGNILFTTVDLSGDGIPELIVCETYTEPVTYYVYTYRNGKVKKLKELGYFSGGKICYLYPSKHILTAMEGDSWSAHTIYYKISGSKMKKVSPCNLSTAKQYTLDSGKYQLKKNTTKNRRKM